MWPLLGLEKEYVVIEIASKVHRVFQVSLAFQKMMADFLGVRLTRSQVEEFHQVVKAEISTHSSYPPPSVPRAPVPSSSSVCVLQ